MIKVSVFVFLVSLLGCGKRQQEIPARGNDTSKVSDTIITDIVLINAGESDRCQIGELLQKISICKPNAIGINLLFIGEKDMTCDSTLHASIIDSDNVVLVEGFTDGNHIESWKKFTEAAFLTGLSGLIQDEAGITNKYYRLIDYQGKWELSFPFLLALQLDKSRAAELSSKVSPQEYPINFYRGSDELTVLDSNADFSNDCSILEGKIVVIGYLGPTQKDILIAPEEDRTPDKAYATVILANIILDILKDLKDY